MRPNERFTNTWRFHAVDTIPCMEIAVRAQTRRRWIEEGMSDVSLDDFNYLPGRQAQEAEGLA